MIATALPTFGTLAYQLRASVAFVARVLTIANSIAVPINPFRLDDSLAPSVLVTLVLAHFHARLAVNIHLQHYFSLALAE
jgi:hypothetical protein